MKNYLKYFLCGVVLLTQNLAYSASLSDKTKDFITNYSADHTLNAVYMMTEDGKTITSAANGFYAIEKQKRLKANQLMPVASGTKPITAAAVLRLQDKGLLNVHYTVAKLLPASSGMWPDNKLPKWAHKMTLHHLMTHTSGLAEYIPTLQVDFTKTHKEINQQILGFSAQQNLKFSPGDGHEYNNTGFIILGIIIEHVAKENLVDFYYNEFFKPLGMKDTFLCALDQGLKYQRGELNHTYPHRYFVIPTGADPKFVPAKIPFLIAPFSDGGMLSTAKDMVKWHNALHNGKILSENSYRQMTTAYGKAESKDGLDTHYGYGLFIKKLPDGQTLYGHAGNAIAIRSEFGYVLESKYCFAILSNIMVHVPEEMKDKIDFTQPQNQLDIAFFRNGLLKAIAKDPICDCANNQK